MAEQRQTGMTTKQIESAPQGALYCWVSSNTWYPKELAAHLGRKDLRLCGPEYIRNERHRGLSVPIVVDHAALLPPEVNWLIMEHNARVRR